jgi:hypothetical protein
MTKQILFDAPALERNIVACSVAMNQRARMCGKLIE